MFGYSIEGFAVLLNGEIETYGINTKEEAIQEAKELSNNLFGHQKSEDIEIIKYEKIDW